MPLSILSPSSPLSLLSLSSWLSSLWLPLAPVEERGSCGAILSTRVSHFSSPGVEEECEARVEVQDGVCHLRLQYEELSPASGCLLVSKGRKGEGGSRLCGSRGGLETLLPVGRKEQVYLTTDSLARWKVRLVQEQCSRANSRLLLLQEDQGQAQCPAHRGRRAAPATMLEIAQKRARGKVASAFFQVVEASNMELSRAAKSPSSQVQSSQRNQSGKQRRRKKQRRRRRRKLSSIFPAPLPGWLGRISRPSGPPCPAFLLSPLTALCPAPCLLGGPTSNLTLRLGPHTRPVSGVLLHPSRQGHDLALLSLPAPLPPSRPPACLSSLTSKYSKLLLPGRSLPPLSVQTVNKWKCGKLGRDEVCVLLEGEGRPRPGDPMVRDEVLEGLYSRKSKSGYHVITELFHLKLWIAAAKQSHDVP